MWEGDYEQPVSLHRFGYSINNPLRFRDPSGYIYLTFDDGPVIGVDNRILSTLAAHGARATFFFIGQQIDLNNDATVEVVWRVASEGHRLGNHSYNHLTEPHNNLTNMCWEDVLGYLSGAEGRIRQALKQVKQEQPYRYYALTPDIQEYIDKVIEQGTGLFRPPGGSITPDQTDLLDCWNTPDGGTVCPTGLDNPYEVYKWDVDPRDWAIADAYADGDLTYEQATEMLLGRLQHGWHKYGVIGKVLRNLRPSPGGSFGIRSDSDIVLLHSNAFTVEILDEILRQLTEAGYTFSPLITSWEK